LPDPLLITKLHNPRRSIQSIARPRLTGLVNDFIQAGQPLLLISAPAGFGKTSLLSEWASQSRWSVTWLSLDEEDNDPARFWSYLIAALQTLQSDLGENALSMLGAREPLSQPDQSFLTVLLNEISTFPEPFVLITDAYHRINNSAIHTSLTFMIDHLPSQMRLILTSRSDPLLPLARWRASSQMAEIRAGDLRFTVEEAYTFLVDIMGLSLTSGEVSALVDRTEGWIAGLQLAALAMQSRPDIPAFIADFTGSHHYIFDYLAEEILQRQPEPVQSFLLRTSILDRLCAPLCDAILGDRDQGIRDKGSPIPYPLSPKSYSPSREILEYLERTNLFIIPLDDERQWYRYHQLFAEMLRHRLEQTQPALVPELHHSASVWFEQNGFVGEAIRHALAGGDFERAADLVELNAITIYWRRGEIATMMGWLEALPDELVYRRPQLCLLHAWTLLISGRFAEVEPRLADLEKSLAETQKDGAEPVEIQGIRGQVAAIRARLARITNDLPRSIELCLQALEYLPPEDVFLRGVISLNLGLAYWQSGDIAAARRVLDETSAVHEPGRMLSTSLAAQAFLADLQAEQGHLRQAAGIYQQAIQAAKQPNGQPSPMASWAYVGMGKILLQWNDLEAAGRYLDKGLELAKRWGAADGLAWAYLHLGQWKAAYGFPEEAEEKLSQAEQILRQSRVAPWTAAEVSGYRGRLWISQKKIAETVLWAQEHGLELENEISYLQLPEYLSLARLLLHQDRLDEMDRLLGRMLRLSERSGLTGRAIEILALQAFALQAQGKNRQAGETLEHALTLAGPEGYLRLFLDESERIKMVLEEYLHLQRLKPDGADHTAAAGLLAILNRREDGQTRTQPQAAGLGVLIEPLSAREIEILDLLAEGLSNREIAQRLFISTGTVKVHLKHIFNKLEVGNRTEAAARARQLSLI
jgi:LuxR family maltose regulon positive regulatory protein